ncbi:uncharacterized protein [Rutidosis leptorrhynchoides]|uniref:uncharacterized protein n=1 Tax=Rutidosis leptorrhynchoides TaxID=125765 RepID=UPI003A98FBB7
MIVLYGASNCGPANSDPCIGPQKCTTSNSGNGLDVAGVRYRDRGSHTNVTGHVNKPSNIDRSKRDKSQTSKRCSKSKSIDVSFCNNCYWSSLMCWSASFRIRRAKNMAKTGVNFANQSKLRCKGCGKKSKSKKSKSNRNHSETKCKTVEDRWVHSLWGNSDVGFIQKEAVGNSGGLLLIWDTNSFMVNSAMGNDYFIAIRGNWVGSGQDSIIVNVYGSHNDACKKLFWASLFDILCKIDLAWFLCGNLNEVREESERLNCVFHCSRAKRFNEFIMRNNLVEIGLNGRMFTRISDDGTKFSKLDRFLVSDKFLNLWDDLSVNALWVEGIVCEAWGKMVNGSRKDCIFRDRLKRVKFALKDWSKSEFGNIDNDIAKLKFEVFEWEKKAESGFGNPPGLRPVFLGRAAATGPGLFSLSEANACTLELSFSETEIWDAVKGCGGSKAPGPDGFNLNFYKKFWNDIKHDLIAAVQWFWDTGEISRGCNASFITLVPKRSNPTSLNNYRPISLIGSYYKIIAKILSNRLKKVVPNLVGFKQSAFIKGRNILDGALKINKTLEFIRKKHDKCLIFKVDLEKAFDCLNWDFLMEVMELMGFGVKWRSWILTCIKSASISILVNGSPMDEFKFERGVRQGDPLSPFLFIIVAEGLNLLTKSAVQNGLFSRGGSWQR